MRYGLAILLTLCIAAPYAAAAAGAHEASVAAASCSSSMQPSEATRAVTQTALLACTTVMQPTGALDWFIDVQQVRLRDILDGSLVDAVQLPPHPNMTLAELVQLCWPSSPLPVRVFLSAADHQSHSRACATAAAAAADALHSPLLALTRMPLPLHSLSALRIALAASLLPHVTVAVMLFYTVPAAMALAPLWSSAIILFAVIDLCHTLSRALAAFRASTNQFLAYFARRLFVRIALALAVAVIDNAAAAASDGTRCLAFVHILTFLGCPPPTNCPPLLLPLPSAAPVAPLLANLALYIYCFCFVRHYWKHRRCHPASLLHAPFQQLRLSHPLHTPLAVQAVAVPDRR